jgi:hypothetical protein
MTTLEAEMREQGGNILAAWARRRLRQSTRKGLDHFFIQWSHINILAEEYCGHRGLLVSLIECLSIERPRAWVVTLTRMSEWDDDEMPDHNYYDDIGAAWTGHLQYTRQLLYGDAHGYEEEATPRP